MSSINVIRTETIYEGKSELEKITYEQKDPAGQTHSYQREIFKRPDAATILLYDSDRQKLLFTEQLRLPVYLRQKDVFLLEACAGLMNPGELPEHCIVREVEEETGYRISRIRKVFEAYSSPAAYTEYIHFFLGEYSPELKVSEGGGVKQEGEKIKTIELSYREARDLLSSGQIHDSKTIILVQYAILNHIL